MKGWVGAQRKLQAGGKVIPAEARYVQLVPSPCALGAAANLDTTIYTTQAQVS